MAEFCLAQRMIFILYAHIQDAFVSKFLSTNDPEVMMCKI